MAREPEHADFEPIPVARDSRRAIGVAAGWLGGLIVIVGIATLNVTAGGDTSVAPGVATASALIAQAAPTPASPVALLSIVEARSFDAVAGIDARRLEITGRLLIHADRVRITLEGREDRILGTIVRHAVRLPPRDAPWGDLGFAATFELPAWRSGGMWVTVTAFDADGARIGRLRERVEVYPVGEELVSPGGG